MFKTQSIFVFPDIAKLVDSWWKNADAKRNQEAGFPIVGGSPPILRSFSKPPRPLQNWCLPMGRPPQLKNEFPPLKREPPSMKWFLGKSQQITQNLAKILEKYAWRSLFLVNLQACRLIADNFTNKWTPS